MRTARNRRVLRTMPLPLIVAMLCSFACGKVIYVDAAAGANDGSSWANAYAFLQEALADARLAEKPVEIRVAQGIYRPNQGLVAIPEFDWRTTTFQLINGVTLKGGYAGLGQPDPNARDIELYETTLSGDLNGDDGLNFTNNFENSYHVVTGSGTDGTAVLDGFTVTAGNADSYISSRGGGGMRNEYGNPTLTNCTFTSNSARWYGGGMYNADSSPALTNCTFVANSADHSGGAMYNEYSSPTLIECTFSYNWSQGGGGMENSDQSGPILTDCKFIGNSAVFSGGGMYNSESAPTLSGCTFLVNSASSGGGIYNRFSSPQIFSCTFTDNRVISSGGGMSNLYDSNPTLTDCRITGNAAGVVGSTWGYGGGMHNDLGGSPRLTNCTITANHSTVRGGGLCNEREASPTLINCRISGNTTALDGVGYSGGGGIYNTDGGSLLLINCIISGNAAKDGNGGGLYNMNWRWSSRATLTNCTFAGNSAALGYASACDSYNRDFPSTIQLTNCIFWDNGNEIWNNDNSIVTLTYNDVYGLTGSRFGLPNGNTNEDPCFVEPGYLDANGVWVDGDYHLKSQAGRWDPNSRSWVVDDVTSPCIDAGDPNSPVGDEPEPNGGRINMGAYGGTAEASKSYTSRWFVTTGGPLVAEGLGIVLPHEHIFTDLRGPTTPGYGQADPADVVRVMAPLLADARRKGVGVMIECSSIGVGRNVSIVAQVAEAAGLPVVVPTGVYGRANFAPPEHQNMTEDELTTLFTEEIRDGIEGTGIKAGFIKIATDNGPMTALEEKFLRAAGRAASRTGAAIASHTPTGTNAVRQADILQSIDPAIRLIWVHAQNEGNRSLHRQLAARGVFIEFDSLGWNPGQDSTFITAIKDLLAAGHADRILLSHDAGWYQPGQRNGGTQKPYTYLIDAFIRKLRSAGVDDATIRMITETNPIRAFGFKSN